MEDPATKKFWKFQISGNFPDIAGNDPDIHLFIDPPCFSMENFNTDSNQLNKGSFCILEH